MKPKKLIERAKQNAEKALVSLKAGMIRNHPYETKLEHIIQELDDHILTFDEDYCGL